jgi:hypothetical protein
MNIYEYQFAPVTYRWWIGASDQRIYKMTSEGTNSTTIQVKYDPSINIQPPIP